MAVPDLELAGERNLGLSRGGAPTTSEWRSDAAAVMLPSLRSACTTFLEELGSLTTPEIHAGVEGDTENASLAGMF